MIDLNNDWKQARPSYNLLNKVGSFNGYQTFDIKQNSVTPKNKDLIIKSNIVKPILEKYITNETTFLDLGCANFYFGFLANVLGAKNITGVEVDKDYINIINKIVSDFSLKNIQIVEQNVQDYQTPHDVVNACAIIHWIYSCSASFGSIESVIDYFYNITNKFLIVEWIDNKDAAIKYFNHINYNSSDTKKDYNKESFLNNLTKRFSTIQFLGNTEPTRELYFATK